MMMLGHNTVVTKMMDPCIKGTMFYKVAIILSSHVYMVNIFIVAIVLEIALRSSRNTKFSGEECHQTCPPDALHL